MDSALVASENTESVLRDRLGKHFELKKESIGSPRFYFCSSGRKAMIPLGLVAERWPLMRR